MRSIASTRQFWVKALFNVLFLKYAGQNDPYNLSVRPVLFHSNNYFSTKHIHRYNTCI